MGVFRLSYNIHCLVGGIDIQFELYSHIPNKDSRLQTILMHILVYHSLYRPFCWKKFTVNKSDKLFGDEYFYFENLYWNSMDVDSV